MENIYGEKCGTQHNSQRKVCESEQFTACSKHYSVIAYGYAFNSFKNKIIFKNLPLNMHISIYIYIYLYLSLYIYICAYIYI